MMIDDDTLKQLLRVNEELPFRQKFRRYEASA